MVYAIENLGTKGFEQMSAALLCAQYGAGVRVFGPGRDDGRDATLEGLTLDVTGSSGTSSWDGYHVFQAKYRERSSSNQPDFSWLEGQIKGELRSWTSRDEKNRLKRKGPRPAYYVFITNVALSGQLDGQIETLRHVIREWAARDDSEWELKDCDVWDFNKVQTLLDTNADVRRRFRGMLTDGDVLERIMEALDLAPGLSGTESTTIADEYTRAELASRDMLALAEAGDRTNHQLDLATAAVDLPARNPDAKGEPSRIDVLRHVIALGNKCHSPSLIGWSTPHLLVVGGPGQGKTTLGRILVQNYRAALLRDHQRLSEAVLHTVGAVTRRASDLGLPEVTNKRWPFRVDLAKYAAEVAGGDEFPLIEFIGKEIQRVTGERTGPTAIRRWLESWPWLLVLDGYDEVNAATSREQVARAVTALLEVAETADADLIVIATTRPQGYADELPISLRKLELLELEPTDAVTYAKHVTQQRLVDAKQINEVVAKIEDALQDEVTARLMRTPLQVMIMSLLLEFHQRLPKDRAALFQAYYDTIYAREVHKPGALSQLLSEHQQDVLEIHMRAGLNLQIRSQEARQSDATMTTTELNELISARLTEQGYTGRELERRVVPLARAAHDRLVLLAATGNDHVRFDLRSLQEFMAAKRLAGGRETDVKAQLAAIAPSAHWRNTWLLAMGVLHREKELLFTEIVEQLPTIDEDDWLHLLTPLGAELAIGLLQDGLASGTPRYVGLLVTCALPALERYGDVSSQLGRVLASMEDPPPLVRAKIIQALQGAAGGKPRQRAAAKHVVERLTASTQTGALATSARQLSAQVAGAEPFTLDHRFATSKDLKAAIRKLGEIGDPGSLARTFFDDLRIHTTSGLKMPKGAQAKLFFLPSVAHLLIKDTDQMEIVVQAIGDIDDADWPVQSTISHVLYLARAHHPVNFPNPNSATTDSPSPTR